MDQCVIATFTGTFRILDDGEVGAAWRSADAFVHVYSLEKCKTHLVPSRLNFTTVVHHCAQATA